MKTLIVLFATFAAFIPTLSSADVPAGWKSFRGAYFEVGVPPAFTAKAIKEENDSANGGNAHDAVKVIHKALKVEFSVFSPQWDGVAPFFKINEATEVLADRKTKKSGKDTVEELTITAKDKSYTRYVLSQSFSDEANSTHTNKTFSIQVPDAKTHDQVKKLHAQWKKTLVQLAD
jgi:hypothetical protein